MGYHLESLFEKTKKEIEVGSISLRFFLPEVGFINQGKKEPSSKENIEGNFG